MKLTNTAPRWTGKVPANDDFGFIIDNAFIDGATIHGPWAIMVPAAHAKVGRGLGTGKGQRYERAPDGKWYKVAG